MIDRDSQEVRELTVLIKIHMAQGEQYFIGAEQITNCEDIAYRMLNGEKVYSVSPNLRTFK